MKFYVNGKLEAELFGEEGVERCLACPYAILDCDELQHTCSVDADELIIEDMFKLDTKSIECHLGVSAAPVR